MIEELLQALKERWGYDNQELNDIRNKLVDYGLACVHDPKIRDEALEIALADTKEPTNIIYLSDYEIVS